MTTLYYWRFFVDQLLQKFFCLIIKANDLVPPEGVTTLYNMQRRHGAIVAPRKHSQEVNETTLPNFLGSIELSTHLHSQPFPINRAHLVIIIDTLIIGTDCFINRTNIEKLKNNFG